MGKLSDLDDSKRFKSGLLKGYLKQIAKPPSPSSGEFTSFTLLITLLWYTSNISVVILNKFLLSSFNFKKPFVLTLCHMLLSSCLSYFVSTTNVHKVQYVKTRLQFIKICVLALVFVTSVGLGNVSLRYIPVSFNQAIGACTPFFTAILVILIQGKERGMKRGMKRSKHSAATQRPSSAHAFRIRIRNLAPALTHTHMHTIRLSFSGKFESKITYVTLVPVVLGIIITTRGEPLFNAIGFMACLGSTSCRALKSVIQSVLLNSESEKMTSMNLLRYMAPIASCALITVVSLTEPQSLGETIDLITTNKGTCMRPCVRACERWGEMRWHGSRMRYDRLSKLAIHSSCFASVAFCRY